MSDLAAELDALLRQTSRADDRLAISAAQAKSVRAAIAVLRQRDALRAVVLAMWEHRTGTADVPRADLDAAMIEAGMLAPVTLPRSRVYHKLTTFGRAARGEVFQTLLLIAEDLSPADALRSLITAYGATDKETAR